MTIAKTMTEKNGHSSQPNKPQDTRNKARKNHNIMSRGDDGLKLPPRMIGYPVAYPIRTRSGLRSHFKNRILAQGCGGATFLTGGILAYFED